MSYQAIVDGLIWYFVFVYSTVAHEAGHAWAALRLGDDTAHRGGQVSLDPIPHIRREPFGMVIVPIISWFLNNGNWMIGWASAPYDRTWAVRYPRRAAWMSLAGPAANLAIGLLCALLIHVGIEWGVFAIPESAHFTHIVVTTDDTRLWAFCAQLLSIGFSLQCVLFSFNLLPLPPLDGSALPLFFLSESGCEKYQELLANPTLRLFGIIIAWRAFGGVFPIFWKLALHFLYPHSY